MRLEWNRIVSGLARIAPEGSTVRKLIQIVSIVLLFEGLSVIILFSKIGVVLGLASIVIGLFLLAALRPTSEKAPSEEEAEPTRPAEETFGIKVIETIHRLVGKDYGFIALGFLVILAVLVFNSAVSINPDLGDLDILVIMLGGMLLIYPFARPKFKLEAAFSLMFISLVVAFLVLPQSTTLISGGDGESSLETWYVHYMLAAPFASILNAIGISAHSSGNLVTIGFADGTVQTLGISTYCAGLYSFSIFLSAFFSFVMVFERLRPSVLLVVLALGLVIAYLGNLFRMVVIGVVGHYKGMDALLWTHENIGWVIFLTWSAVFWYLVLNFASDRKPKDEPHAEGD